jgi:hypothetical protein
MNRVETDEWGHSQKPYIKRDPALAPFVLDSLQSFGKQLADTFLSEYENLSGQPGASKFTAHDHHLLTPHQQIVKKLRELPQEANSKIILEAQRELRMVEDHVGKMRKEWTKAFRNKSESKRLLAALRTNFTSGPDVPHLSLFGDIPAIRASFAYKKYKAENPKFAFTMAWEELCDIKVRAQESGGITFDSELAELMTIPKTALRTLSAIRSLT